jgi:hypothetical protein
LEELQITAEKYLIFAMRFNFASGRNKKHVEMKLNIGVLKTAYHLSFAHNRNKLFFKLSFEILLENLRKMIYMAIKCNIRCQEGACKSAKYAIRRASVFSQLHKQSDLD